MTIRTLWTICIKILGLWLVLECLTIVPQFFMNIIFMFDETELQENVMWISITLGTIVFFLMIIRTCLFRTNWIIDKLHLEKDFKEEKIDLNSTAPQILRIAIVVLGGFILVESVPAFCKELFSFIQQKIIFREYPSSGWLIFDLIKLVIGYLLLTNSKIIATFIDKQTKESKTE